MAWCPNCKLEYVEGVKICPDCKTALVESLEKYEAEEQEELEGEALEQVMYPGMQMELPDEETRKELYELAKKIKENPPYKSKEEQLNTNKSGAGVLIVCGVLGILILLLNSLGILNLPMQGFSKILMTAVMGCLFIVFLLSGIRSILKIKTLTPEAEEEKKLIQQVLDFIKEQKENGRYSVPENTPYEEAYLQISDRCVTDINENFPDLVPGFAFYVVDRFASDILDNED